MNERFEVPARLRNTSLVLIAVGVLALVAASVTLLGANSTDVDHTRFWAGLLHNSVYFAFLAIISVFIQAASSLAHGGWIVAYRRVPESIGANAWLFGGIAALVIILNILLFKDHHGHNPIFHWVNPHGDAILEGKSPFLNKGMVIGFTIVTVVLWGFFGRKFRAMSIAQESAPKNSTKGYFKFMLWAALFLVVFALTMMSTTPWMWIMSIDAHWYSTLFSWYVFASSLVGGMSMILLFTVYLKNQGHLPIVNKEHIHDLGKFMFAISVFWTYLWFAQYMLIWYANIPEETTYFIIRQHGPYSILFYGDFIINFVMPLLILMSRPSKRNYFTVCVMALIIIFGHWLDFYQMMMPGPLGANWEIGWYELGLLAGFVGLLIFSVSKTLSKASLVPHNNPLLKESVIHIS
ncbi:MAG: quinol:cytochrome C oxidoreductase [Chitinophagaceae bacterium]